jgi:hypothetical protein
LPPPRSPRSQFIEIAAPVLPNLFLEFIAGVTILWMIAGRASVEVRHVGVVYASESTAVLTVLSFTLISSGRPSRRTSAGSFMRQLSNCCPAR